MGDWGGKVTFEESPYYDVGEDFFSRQWGEMGRDGGRRKVDVEGDVVDDPLALLSPEPDGPIHNLNFDLLKIDLLRRVGILHGKGLHRREAGFLII